MSAAAVRGAAAAGCRPMPTIVGDREVAALFGYNVGNLTAFQKKLRPSYQCPPGHVDVRLANPVLLGKKRRWILEDVIDLIRNRPAQTIHEMHTPNTNGQTVSRGQIIP